MRLDHPDLEPFEPMLADFAEKAETPFKDRSAIRPTRWPEARKALRKFHYDCDIAQRGIGRKVIELEQQIRHEKVVMRGLRRERQRDAAKRALEKIRILERRQLILRGLIDTVLARMIARNWTLKHFQIDDGIRGIDPTVLERTLAVAFQRNRENPARFSIVSDLTTVVHIGDLVEIEWKPSGESVWSLVELKEGSVNELLHDFLGTRGHDPTDDDWARLHERFGKHTVIQAKRMFRQRKRRGDVTDLLTRDEGFSPRFGNPMRLSKDTVTLDDYRAQLSRICEEAQGTGLAITTIDNCLRIVAIDQAMLKKPGTIEHSFYHLANPAAECAIPTGDETAIRRELEAMSKIVPINLVVHGVRNQSGTSIFTWATPRRAAQLLAGNLRIFGHLDTDAFFRLAASQGIVLEWRTDRPTEEIVRSTQIIPGSPNAWGIRASLKDGRYMTFLSGMTTRMFFDLTLPSEILRLMKISIDRLPAGFEPV